MPRTRGLRWLVAGMALVALIAAFDWTWFRPLIQHVVQQRSGRRVDFDRLRIGLDGHFSPSVRLSNLRVQNAAWAAPEPLIRAAEFSATFKWSSFFHGERIIVTRMRLVDAEVDLEQQADGLRNWRITRPEDRGPGRVRVLTLEAVRSRARFVHRGLQLELQLQADLLPAVQTLAGFEALPLTKTLAVRGVGHGVPFDGVFAVSDVISLFDSNQTFALRGAIGTAAARLSVQGAARDLLQLSGLDVDLQLAGTRLADLAAIARAQPLVPALAADASAHLHKEGRAWNASRLNVRLGRSDLTGTLDYTAGNRAGERPPADAPARLRATLVSRRVDLAEWRAARSGGQKSASPVMPPNDATPWSLDAQVDWQIAQLDGLPLPVSELRAHAAWRDERLTLAPLSFVLAGGSATGRISLAAAASSLELQLDGLRVGQLGVHDLDGRLNARVALRSRGDSVDAMLATLAGSAEAELHAATLPAALDAKLGLNGGRWLRALISGRGQRSAVVCSALRLRFENGVGALQRLALETDTVVLNGSGSIDLPRRRVKALITPRRKQSAWFALDDSIRIEGTLPTPAVTLVPGAPQAGGAEGCA